MNDRLYKIVNENENEDGYVYIDQEFEVGNYEDGENGSEIALCVLAAINLGELKNLEDLEDICENIVRSLDLVIEYQDYPVNAARKMLKRRSLGIGVTNFAYWLAKQSLNYDDPKTLDKVDELFEHIQYYCIKASIKLAKEFGACEWFNRTKYSKGILPIDTYNKNVDKLVKRKYSLDWEQLRKDVLDYGMRNSTLTACMPCESSSLVTNSTNGLEPIRDLITSKKSKQGIIKLVVPEIHKLKNKYQQAFDLNGNDGMNSILSVIQKWIDQGISANHYYDFNKFEDGNISMSSIAKDILTFYKYGGKQIYYSNSSDGKTDNIKFSLDKKEEDEHDHQPLNNPEIQEDLGCEGGACSI
jgi:ribonucleoside-diphosphate reductase alpha chain